MANTEQKIDVPPEVFKLYDAYCHGDLSRRAFFSKLSAYAVGGVTVSMLAACVMPDYGRAQTAEGEAELIEETAAYKSPKGAGDMSGYLVRPAGARGKLAGIVTLADVCVAGGGCPDVRGSYRPPTHPYASPLRPSLR